MSMNLKEIYLTILATILLLLSFSIARDVKPKETFTHHLIYTPAASNDT